MEGLADSKLLSAERRELVATAIKSSAVAWSIGRAEPGEIDRMNILNATLLAMRRAYFGLLERPDLVLVDGNRAPELPAEVRPIIAGDRIVPAISAASILAKVFRDREMTIADQLYPGYGFAVHKGYPTASHRAALNRIGPCPLHRRSFAPVRLAMARLAVENDAEP
jgi:ribonuclease HII